MKITLAAFPVALALASCGGPEAAPPPPLPRSSSTLALTSDETSLWVVNPDADSVSVIDPATRRLLAEVPLAPAPPAADPRSKRYEPSVLPRALAILKGDEKVYVAGQTAGRVFAIDVATRAVTARIAVGAEPTAVVAAPDGSAVYAVNHQSGTVSKIDPRSDQVVATLPAGEHPFGASISDDGARLYVTRFLLDPGVTVIDTGRFAVLGTVALREQAPDEKGDKRVPNGVARGAYAAVPRPSSGELWVPHVLLAVKTAQPDLDFESTVFPAVSTLDAAARTEGKRLLFKPLAVPYATGAFNDVVSGPRALAFSPDGALALLAASGSEDLMVFDAATGDELQLVRPLPATLLEGVIVDQAGKRAFVDGRNSHNVVVLSINRDDRTGGVQVDGDPIERLAADPMPAPLRLGQRLFYTANSAAFPITQNFWVSCSSCHLEGGTDAVTWLFDVGPRDTPSNAGGPINTGFLLRQAARARVEEYDATINIEQGGNFHRDRPSQAPLLEALAAYVNYAIPLPQNPHAPPGGAPSDAEKRGKALFDAKCASCHGGPFYTDSGAGNPTLDPAGPVVLHDVGTCVKAGPFPDRPFADAETGTTRTACDFDTPALRGVFATPPYFHDGSAATLADVVDRLPTSAGLSPAEKQDLVAYLLTL